MGITASPTPRWQLAEVCRGRVGTLHGKPSAIRKHSVAGRVTVGPLGLEGDEQGDRTVHGGVDKAVHLYPRDHYPLLSGLRPELADRLTPGVLGENLSISGIDESSCCLGDRFRVGTVLFEVSQPRRPCWKIDARLESEGMVRLFHELGTTGWYFRVLEPGELGVGDAVELVERPRPDLTIRDLFTTFHSPTPDADRLRDFATAPGLTQSWVERLLRRANAAPRLG